MRVAELVALIRASHPVADSPAAENSNFQNDISNAEIRGAENPSPPTATATGATGRSQIRRPRRKYKTPELPVDLDSSEDLFESSTQTQAVSVLIPAPAPPATRRSIRLQHPRLPKPDPPCPPAVLTEEDRLRWKEARRQRRLFERDFPRFNRACTKAESKDRYGVEDPDYQLKDLDQLERSPTPGYSTDDSIPEPPSDTELYGLQVKDTQQHG